MPDAVARTKRSPRRVDKPWGHELIWAETDAYVGKLLEVRAGHSLSLQYHEVKDESWLVEAGEARLGLGIHGEDDDNLTEITITAGDTLRFEPGTLHKLTAVSDLRIIEVSTPHLEDVVRLDDSYGRAGTSDP
jgi:mannose-6-phosphate isomerase